MDILNNIFEARIRSFFDTFCDSANNFYYNESENKLIHPGEYGLFREKAIRHFLSELLPDRFGVSHGFIVTQEGWVSRQCDVIIYSKDFTPKISTPEGQMFFPIESVVSVGEVKSKLYKVNLMDSLEHLESIKKARGEYQSSVVAHRRVPKDIDWDAKLVDRDQVITFVFSESSTIDKGVIWSCVNSVVDVWARCNAVASAREFCATYRDTKKIIYLHPNPFSEPPAELVFIAPTKSQIHHLKVFFRLLLMEIENATICYPEFNKYFDLSSNIELLD